MNNRNQFYSHFTRTLFIHVEDALDIGKIRFFAGKYQRGNGMEDKGAYAFLDVNDARPVLMDLSWGKPVNLIDYKGGTNGGGEIVSRVLSVKSSSQKKNDGSLNTSIWIEIKNGPGKRTDTGAVMPAGKATASVAIPFSVEDARRMALAILAYISAHETVQAMIEMGVVNIKSLTTDNA